MIAPLLLILSSGDLLDSSVFGLSCANSTGWGSQSVDLFENFFDKSYETEKILDQFKI